MHRQRDDILSASSQGEAGRSAHDAGSFDPGSSFMDEDATRPLDGSLPSWLQNFAEVTGHEDVETPQVEQHVQPTPNPARHETSASARPGDGASVDFFNDDDLPEWLRAISVEQPDHSDTAPAESVEVVEASTISVPLTSRAWVSPHEHAEPVNGSSLFAAIAHEADERPNIDAGQPTPATPVGASMAAPAAAGKPLQPPATVMDEAGRDSNHKRLMLLVALIVVVALIVIMLGR